MAYRRPGVTVTQEFVGLVPALAAFSLPSIVVGPAFQLVDDDDLGAYAGVEQTYEYASALGGSIVDLEQIADDEAFPITKREIEAYLKDALVEVVDEQATGAVNGTAFADATASIFADVEAGDIVSIVPKTGVEIVAARTDGVSTDTAGQRNRLSAPGTAPTLFADTKVGDVVEVTGGTNTVVGTYAVLTKVGSGLLVLDADVNDGVGPSNDVAFSISGDRGQDIEGDYVIKTVTDENNLVLLSPLVAEAPLSYVIKRDVGDVALDRVATTAENGFVAAAEGITLPLGLTYEGRAILEGDLYASYRALRIDLAAEVRQYTNVTSMNAVFGTGQLVPANPLAYGISVMSQNTVTPVHGLGLDGDAIDNEVLSYTAATDVLKRGEMYAIALLTHNAVVHTTYKNHVEQLSQPERKQERVVIINSLLPTLSVLQEEETTVTTANNSRTIVGTQIDGAGDFATNPKQLTDASTDQFEDVQPGDSLVIISGTGVTPGTYKVATVPDVNTLTTATDFITAGTPTDIQYYIYRKDGVSAGGASFYDRNALFLSNGVAAGHYLSILSGALEGRYKIATVVSEKELTLSPVIAGVVELTDSITYQVDRDLSKPEQADAVKGYSEAFASRRVVHVWPDVLKAPIGQTTYDVPGYFACCSIAALTSGLPTQQGLTNLAISGFLGFSHSTRYFTEEELDHIADGGTMVLAQDEESTPLYVRHQLTTDRSAIKFQEYSITKNVDFIAKFWRATYRKFIGQYNIVDTTLDNLRTTGNAGIGFLRDKTRVPKFGGVIRSGELVSLVESETAIDTVEIRFSHGIPVPLNNIDIVVEV
jgi:hypothetical protein